MLHNIMLAEHSLVDGAINLILLLTILMKVKFCMCGTGQKNSIHRRQTILNQKII